jgi:L-ascorbate metabolism protein UlaG (beta-lactamase superfamily)
MPPRTRNAARGKVALTWLGHSAFLIRSPKGKTIVIDPWLENPKAPPEARALSTADIILVTHGHADHLGNTVSLAERTQAAVIRLENGLTIYHAGDTGVFGDMRIIRDLYKPDIVLLPIGGLFTMGPREAAYACTLLRPKHIIGMHYGTFPALSGTPAQLKRFLSPVMRKKVHELTPGIAVEF